MKIRKLVSAVSAAAVAISALSVSASAAGAFRLLTEPMSTVDGAIYAFRYFYGDEKTPLFYNNDEVSGIDGVFDITSEDLKEWRSTGEFTFTEIDTDIVDFDESRVFYFEDFMGLDCDGSRRIGYSYDGNGKITELFESTEWFYSSLDGYIVSMGEVNAEKVEVVVETPTGEKYTNSFKRNSEDYWFITPCETEKYISYLFYAVDSSVLGEDDDWGTIYSFDTELVGIKRDGSYDKIFSGAASYFGLDNAAADYLLFHTQTAPFGPVYYIYLPETGETISFSTEEVINTARINLLEMNGRTGMFELMDYDGNTVGYQMVKFDEEPYTTSHGNVLYGQSAVGDLYKYIGEPNGGIYLVQTADEKWGYINSEGELLATFDDASSFKGKYAPVVKDGKAFLINRDFKRVSEKIDGTGVQTIDNGLYMVIMDDVSYFMTYAAAQEDSSEPEDKTEQPAQPDSPAEETTSAEPTTETPVKDTENVVTESDKGNPDTGAFSVGGILGAAVIAGGAVLLSRKRRIR